MKIKDLDKFSVSPWWLFKCINLFQLTWFYNKQRTLSIWSRFKFTIKFSELFTWMHQGLINIFSWLTDSFVDQLYLSSKSKHHDINICNIWYNLYDIAYRYIEAIWYAEYDVRSRPLVAVTSNAVVKWTNTKGLSACPFLLFRLYLKYYYSELTLKILIFTNFDNVIKYKIQYKHPQCRYVR